MIDIKGKVNKKVNKSVREKRIIAILKRVDLKPTLVNPIDASNPEVKAELTDNELRRNIEMLNRIKTECITKFGIDPNLSKVADMILEDETKFKEEMTYDSVLNTSDGGIYAVEQKIDYLQLVKYIKSILTKTQFEIVCSVLKIEHECQGLGGCDYIIVSDKNKRKIYEEAITIMKNDKIMKELLTDNSISNGSKSKKLIK